VLDRKDKIKPKIQAIHDTFKKQHYREGKIGGRMRNSEGT